MSDNNVIDIDKVIIYIYIFYIIFQFILSNPICSNDPNDTLTNRMTGVGGRPEVIVEGSDDLEGKWQELNFLFKPGDVNRRLPVVG